MSPATCWRRRREALSRAAGRLPGSLFSPGPATPAPTPEARRRRRLVVAGVGLCGSGLLARGLSARPGSTRFYVLTLGVATAWTAGALASGPLSLGWVRLRDDSRRRPVALPILTGVAAFGVFWFGALLARRIPVLNRALVKVLRFADRGSTPLVVLTTCANAVGEELFFRGALFDAVDGDRKVATTTAAYLAATAGSGNPALALAAGAMGTLFGLQRRASGGIAAPVLTHLTWSMLMLKYLPPMFRPDSERMDPR